MADCSLLLGLELDPSRPPFVFAGNLQDRSTRKILTFGLAPFSHSEYRPQNLEDYYSWRLDYFNTSKRPHRIHCYYARLCWGILGVEPTGDESDSQWLHHNGYLTFDLLPYYVKRWRSSNWNAPGVLEQVQQHFFECIGLVPEGEVRFAIFSRKAWEDLWISNPPSARICDFRADLSFRLSQVTGKPYHRCTVYVGRLPLKNRHGPAVVMGSLIHQIRGLTYDDTLAVGRFIGNQLPDMQRQAGTPA